jgi:hypothetical protein
MEKSSPKTGFTYGNLKRKLPKVNNRPIGENSPNLVTLLSRSGIRNWKYFPIVVAIQTVINLNILERKQTKKPGANPTYDCELQRQRCKNLQRRK